MAGGSRVYNKGGICGWDYSMCVRNRIVYFILVYCNTRHPRMSCTGVNPETTLGTTPHHVLKCGFHTMARRPFGALATRVVTCVGGWSHRKGRRVHDGLDGADLGHGRYREWQSDSEGFVRFLGVF